MDFGEALKRPFSDWKKLSLVAVMYMIPVVSFITQFFASGYILTCGKTAMKKQMKLPEWNFGDAFVKGLVALVISIIYLIPLLVVAVIALGTTAITALAGGQDAAAAIIGSLGVGGVIIVLVAVLSAYVIPVALLMYVSEDRFGAAFRFGDVLKKAFTGKYLIAWLVSMVVAAVISVIGLFLTTATAVTVILPFIIGGFVNAVSGIIGMTLMGDALAK
jgi:hypothetical protein